MEEFDLNCKTLFQYCTSFKNKWLENNFYGPCIVLDISKINIKKLWSLFLRNSQLLEKDGQVNKYCKVMVVSKTTWGIQVGSN